MRPADGGRMNVQNNDVTVTFTVRVPAGARSSARPSTAKSRLGTVNGSITPKRE